MASDELSVPESVLRTTPRTVTACHFLLIHVTRQQFSLFKNPHWPWSEFSNVLKAASKFNSLDTSPELQHDFCDLWNQIVRKVQEDTIAFGVLPWKIRNFSLLYTKAPILPQHISPPLLAITMTF
ncbi:hypothetical protein EI94DRAFT_1811109 [Lactarius quietus]|nr:hypothetical protein EI94DRAFT_1811109 [Lactarius quietus]